MYKLCAFSRNGLRSWPSQNCLRWSIRHELRHANLVRRYSWCVFIFLHNLSFPFISLCSQDDFMKWDYFVFCIRSNFQWLIIFKDFKKESVPEYIWTSIFAIIHSNSLSLNMNFKEFIQVWRQNFTFLKMCFTAWEKQIWSDSDVIKSHVTWFKKYCCLVKRR